MQRCVGIEDLNVLSLYALDKYCATTTLQLSDRALMVPEVEDHFVMVLDVLWLKVKINCYII